VTPARVAVGGGVEGRRQEVMRMSAHDETGEVNEVTLVGRMSQPAEEQVLPSGTALWKFRVIVGRPPSDVSKTTVDSLDCVVWAKRPARAVAGWRSGDVVEVRGSLRRRFFSPATGGRVSRCEVEVATAKLIRRATG
jgi:single-strand DNA-binding protein